MEPSATGRNISTTQPNSYPKDRGKEPRSFYLIYNRTMKIQEITPIHKGKIFSLETVNIAMPTGPIKTYERVNHPDSVSILPLDEDGNIWFVNQYRIGSEGELLELPAGVMEGGEDPLSSAQREIREEIGMAARSWQPLGSLYLAPGYCTEINHIFLAEHLYSAPLSPDEDEYLTIVKIPCDEILNHLKKEAIKDCKSIAALGLFLLSPRLSV